ncbi:IS1595 family transposase [Roseibium algicola]|uniref:IS1595 family transposase n=1 Tax=Roseibium algicola TaxID=2857014 RepID=UPI00345A32E7
MFDLTNPIYHDADKAREHLEAIHWPDGPSCPHCGNCDQKRITKLQGKSTRPGVFKCKECRKPFSVTVGTVFERSKIPLNKWVLATHLMAASKKGMSAHQLHRMLGVTYKTAWFMAHRIREAMAPSPKDKGPLGGEGKTVEADTTYVGGKEKNKHLSKRNARNIGGMGKQVVHVLVERGGKAKSDHIANVTGKTLRPIIVKQVDRKSTLMTDEHGGYFHVGKEFAHHEKVDHGAREYVRGDAYSNTAEGYFAILKRGIIGVYHHVSEAHLKRYLAEFDFRYNYRASLKVSDRERADKLLEGARGKRLTYRRIDEAAHA